MADREKVINGLRCLSGEKELVENKCAGCGYTDCQTYAICVAQVARDALELLQAPEIVRCKDCLYFAIKDFWGEFNGIPVLGASNQPTCTKWGDGDCKTSPDGYCFLAERR